VTINPSWNEVPARQQLPEQNICTSYWLSSESWLIRLDTFFLLRKNSNERLYSPTNIKTKGNKWHIYDLLDHILHFDNFSKGSFSKGVDNLICMGWNTKYAY
jgi:hypothetical protein